MKKITLFISILLVLSISAVIVVFYDSSRNIVKAIPKELYRVYLGGEAIATISSKDKLEDYINQKQKEIKDKYNVTNVYPPKELDIQKYVSFEDNITDEKDVYELINEKNPFTIKGYVIKMVNEETKEEKIINVLDKTIFEEAMKKTVEAFISKEAYQSFIDESQAKITSTGKIIEDLYIKEDIKIKESFISTNEAVYTDVNILAKYLLFGTTSEQQKYIVKAGDTIEDIAFNNKLGTSEFLIVNPEFANPKTLLFPGQEVSVGLIQPVINVVVEEHIVEDQVIKYESETEYDNTVAYGVTTVKQAGIDGIERVVQKRQTINGLITNVQIDRASSEVLKSPVKEIIVKGTRSSTGDTVTVSSDGKWVWPTNTPYVITSGYGYRWGEMHAAIDISGTGYGSPIKAARDGVVINVGYQNTRGNFIVISHDSNYYTIYLHLANKYVKVGQEVKAGERIATMGNSGYVRGATGTHLHFGVHVGEPYTPGTKTVNPLKLYR